MDKLANKVVALIGVLLITIGGMTMANAVTPSPTPSPGSGNTGISDTGEVTINVGATADTIAQCNWYLDGVGDGDEPDTLDLVADVGEKYMGTALELSNLDENINVYMQGTSGVNPECSLFADNNGAKLQVVWSGDGFVSDGVDDNLDWLLSESALNIDLDYSNACSADWNLTTAVLNGSWTSSADSKFPMSLSSTDLLTYSTELGALPNCTTTAKYSTSIPAGRVPLLAGADYTFTGPVITMTLVLEVP